jgi:hypothetical protein
MRCNCKELHVIRDHNGIAYSFSTTTSTTTTPTAAAAARISKAFPVGEKYYHRYAVIIHT